MSASKNHHWWPKGVSNFWKDTDGRVGRLSPNGELLRLDPKKFGFIGHAHSIKLSHIPGQSTVWDQNFESEFQIADDNFPRTLRWLESLDREKRFSASNGQERYITPSGKHDEMLPLLAQGIISLAVRSPMSRNTVVRRAEHVRGRFEGLGTKATISERERNALIAISMRDQQRELVKHIGTRGKFAVIYSPDREFIFGDGFLHNLTPSSSPPLCPEILVPLTPAISVLFVRPTRYSTEPKLSTMIVTAEEADMLNHTVQIYSKDMLFFRSQKPVITEEFRRSEHLRYGRIRTPIDKLIFGIPGVNETVV